MTRSVLRTKKIRRTLLSHEQYFNKSEISMAKAILDWLPYEERSADTIDFFVCLRARNLKSHKVHARFAVTVFNMMGANYEQLQKNISTAYKIIFSSF